MASAGRSTNLVVLKILVLGFQASTSILSVFTGWKLSTVPLEVSRNKHCGMAVRWILVYCDIWFCLLRKWSSAFFIKNKVILCSFSCRRDQVYSRAGAVCVRTTTSPCGGMQVYKQLQKRFARSEGFREGKAAWVSWPHRDFSAVRFAMNSVWVFFSNSRITFMLSYFQVFLKQLQYWEQLLALVSTSLVLRSSVVRNIPSYIASGYEGTFRCIWRMIPLITFNFMEGSESLQFLEIAHEILWRIPEKQTLVIPGWRSSIWGELQKFYSSRVDSLATDKSKGILQNQEVWISEHLQKNQYGCMCWVVLL